MNTNRMLFILMLILLICGTGAFAARRFFDTRAMEAVSQKKSAERGIFEAKKAEAEALRKAGEADARKAESEKLKAENERQRAADVLKASLQEKENLTQRVRTAEAEKAAKQKAKEAAEAEAAKEAAEKSAAEARTRELAKKQEIEALALERAKVERDKAVAEAARIASVKRIAESALLKSENERKAAEATAAAERDAKLRMYRRAEGSRAEMNELKRAERLLAAMEAAARGEVVLPEDLPTEGAAEQAEVPSAETPVPENAASVKKPAVPEAPIDPLDEEINQLTSKLNENVETSRQRIREGYRKLFNRLIAEAERDGRKNDADYYRRVLSGFVPEEEKH